MMRWMRLALGAVFLGVVMTAVLAAPSFAFAGKQSLSLSNGELRYFEVTPGKVVTGTLEVTNDGTQQLKVLVYAGDQTVDSKGNVTFSVPSRADLTQYVKPSTWMTIKMPANSKSFGNVPYLDLKPGQRVPVHFSVEVPGGVAPGDHNVYLFFEMYVPPDPTTGTSGQVSGRLAARITLRVKGPVIDKLEVGSISVQRFTIGDSLPYSFRINNLGNIDKRASAAVALLRPNGNIVVKEQPVTASLIYANSSREVTGTLKVNGLHLGKLNFTVQVVQLDELGQPLPNVPTLQQQVAVWLVPLWALIVAGVVLVLLVIGLIWWAASAAGRRAERKRATRAASASAPGRGGGHYDSGPE